MNYFWLFVSTMKQKYALTGYATSGVVCTIIGFLCTMTAFVSPFWLQSWSRIHTPLDRLGLWEFCLDGLIHRLDRRMKSYWGCWWVFAPEYYAISDYLMPPWFRITQCCVTLTLLIHIGATLLSLVYILGCVKNPEPRAFISRFLFIIQVVSGLLMALASILFGCKYNDPYWMPKPELNWPSWGYGMCVMSGFFSFFAAICFLQQKKVDRRNLYHQEHNFPMSGKSTEKLVMRGSTSTVIWFERYLCCVGGSIYFYVNRILLVINFDTHF